MSVVDLANWPVRQRAYGYARIPYGYTSEPGELDCHPDPEMIPFIEQAMDAIDNGSSLRETAAWLSDATGKYISHQGVNIIWKARRGADPKNVRAKKQRAIKRRNAPKTGPEKAKAKLKREVSDARRAATMKAKRLGAWEDRTKPVDAPVEDAGTPTVLETPTVSAPITEPSVIFRPNDGPQTEFLAASEREVLYGGAAGGGKSMALLADPMRYFGNKNFNGLILRRTNDELRELIWKSHDLYPKAYPGAVWKEKKSSWEFPAGGTLWFTYLERDQDVLRYQGQSFCYIGYDELTQHPTPFAYNYMRSRLRTTDPTLPIFIRATTNPGGPGHGWIKKAFIDPAPPNTSFAAIDMDTGEALVYPKGHAKEGQALFNARFIPASLYDNPYLANDGQYEANLLSLPENQRRQLLEGDWNVADGAAFSEFRTSVHVCKPFEVPDNWRKFRSCDYGYSSYSAVHWFAIDPAFETLFIYRELYLSKHTGRDLAKVILQAERGERIDYGVLDSSCWHQHGQVGPSIAEEMIAEGCRWRPSDRTHGARVMGKNRFHEVLKVDPESGRPGIMFFDTCRQIISDLPIIPSDPKGSDDIDPRYASDHAYDSVRYGVMSRPRSYSPFDQFAQTSKRWKPADSVMGY